LFSFFSIWELFVNASRFLFAVKVKYTKKLTFEKLYRMLEFWSRVGLGMLWLSHFLPVPVLRQVGRGVGRLGVVVVPKRRKIVEINLRLCFPELSENERKKLTRAHFASLGEGMFLESILYWGSEERIEKIFKIKGLEHAMQDGPRIFFLSQFTAINWFALTSKHLRSLISIYRPQKSKAFDELLKSLRGRYGAELVSSRAGVRDIVKAMKEGKPYLCLPDHDLGRRESVFVPFFGIDTATTPVLSRLAKLAKAKVIPVVTRLTPEGVEIEFFPAWENFPTDDIEEDTRRMNAFLEEEIRKIPEQYFWVHRRFKTRPNGQARFY
jgi:KDO2-lipid IV(A) lauroyltransferase